MGQGKSVREMLRVKGVNLGLLTPLTREDKVDVEGLRRNLEFAIKNGIHSVSPAATTGEGICLSLREFETVVSTVVNHVKGRVPVYSGASGHTPSEVIRRIKSAKNLGADGAFIDIPPYSRPNQEGLLAHFSEILGTVDLPILIYNSAKRSAVNMLPEIAQKLSREFSNFIAYKEHSMLQIAKVLSLTKSRLAVLAEDYEFLPGLSIGASGTSSPAANVVPRMMVDIYDYYMKGDLKKAREISIRMVPLMELLGAGGTGLETNPAPVKEAMNLIGLSAGRPRLPLVPVSFATRKKLKVVLKKLVPSGEIV